MTVPTGLSAELGGSVVCFYMLETLLHLHWSVYLAFAIELAIQIGLGLRVIMRRRSVGETLAWIFVVFVFPVAGPPP